MESTLAGMVWVLHGLSQLVGRGRARWGRAGELILRRSSNPGLLKGRGHWTHYSAEINPVNPKGNQSWIFTGRTDAEPEAPILWPPDAKGQLIRKDPNAGKDWRQEKGMTEDGMVGWYHHLNWREFEQAPREGEGQGTWHAAVNGVTKRRTRLISWTITTLPPHCFTETI